MPNNRPANPRVALFVTCLVDLHRPTVGFAAIHLLARPAARSRCRARRPAAASPPTTPATAPPRATSRRGILDAFGGYDYVVVPSGSCGGMLRHHCRDLFDDDPNLAPAPEALGDRTLSNWSAS